MLILCVRRRDVKSFYEEQAEIPHLTGREKERKRGWIWQKDDGVGLLPWELSINFNDTSYQLPIRRRLFIYIAPLYWAIPFGRKDGARYRERECVVAFHIAIGGRWFILVDKGRSIKGS